jgi:DNA-binding transcriptional MocR family regulator
MFQLTRSNSSLSLTDQIVEHFSREVDQGRLTEGVRLPSVRQLASRLQVSSHTTMTAYERLVSMGRISSKPGAGYFVASAPRRVAAQEVELNTPAPDTPGGFAHSILNADAGFLHASSGFLPPSWLQDSVPSSSLSRAIKAATAKCTVAPAVGMLRLRCLLAERLRRKEVSAAPANILTTAGASHALYLAARALAAPGEVVFVDDPGYFFLQSQLADLGIRVVGVPRTPDGPDLESLERLAAEYRPKAFFTQSILHNPTGWNISLATSHRLIIAAEQYDFVLVEDDVYGELGSDNLVRLAQFDGLRRVIYIGGFSKVLTPSIRLGFVAARAELIEAMTALKLGNLLSGSLLEEELVAELLESGRFSRHVLHLKERISRTRAPAVNALRQVGVSCEQSAGASPYLWCELPKHYRAADLAAQARREAIMLAPGEMFSRSGGFQHHVRLSIAYAMHPRLIEFFRSNLLPGA